MVQLSQPYVITGKTTALTIWTSVGRVMFLLFNTLPRFVITFLSRSNCLLISGLQSLSTVILESKKRKSVTSSTSSPSICHAVMGHIYMVHKPEIFTIWHVTEKLINPWINGLNSLIAYAVLLSQFCKPLRDFGLEISSTGAYPGPGRINPQFGICFLATMC